MKNFDKNFNPSPFDDKNKDDLDEVLKECEIKNRELEDTLQQLLHFLVFHYQQQQQKEKNKQIFYHKTVKQPHWPLVFVCKTEGNQHTNIFAAMLERKNRIWILSNVYNWLIEHKQIKGNPLPSCKEFCEDFWNKNFENKLI